VVQVCSNNLQEDDHNAISGSISGLAERVAQQEALDAIAEANALVDGIIDPQQKISANRSSK
jgi:hypothetical protein